MLNTDLTPATTNRIGRGFALRLQTAGIEGFVPMPQEADNGTRHAMWKVRHLRERFVADRIGLVDLAAYDSRTRAQHRVAERFREADPGRKRAPKRPARWTRLLPALP